MWFAFVPEGRKMLLHCAFGMQHLMRPLLLGRGRVAGWGGAPGTGSLLAIGPATTSDNEASEGQVEDDMRKRKSWVGERLESARVGVERVEVGAQVEDSSAAAAGSRQAASAEQNCRDDG